MNSKSGVLFVLVVLLAAVIGAYVLLNPPADFPEGPSETVASATPKETSGESDEAAPDALSSTSEADSTPADSSEEAPDAAVETDDEEKDGKKKREGRGSLKGTVSYAQQKGALNKVSIEITLVDWENHEERGEDVVVRTVRPDADGAFEVKNLPWGSYVGIATSSDGFFGIDDATIQERYTEGTLGLQLFPEGKISGRVTADDGTPIAGARVFSTHYKGMLGDTAIDRNWAKALTQKTDEAGNFVLPHLIEGTYELVAQAKGYATGQVDNIKSDTTNAHIILPGNGSVSGTVIDEYSGAPVPDIAVKFTSKFWMDKHEAVSDKTGAFRFPAAPAGEHSLAVEHEQYIVSETAKPVLVTAGQETAGITLPVSLGGLVTGRVYDVDSGKGLPEVEIYLSTMRNGTDEQRISKNATTDSDGKYSFDGLATGAYTIQRRDIDNYPNDYSDPTMRKNITLRAGEQLSDMDFALSQGLTLRGRVVDGEGAPVAEASINANDMQTGNNPHSKSLEDGTFTLAGLSVGANYYVRAYKSGLAGNSVGPVTVTGDKEPDEIELVLTAESTISGIVVDRAGKPVADVGIIARLRDDRGFGSSINESEANGTFKIDRLAPGEYDIVVSPPNNHNFNNPPQETVTIKESGEHISDLKLVYDGTAGMSVAGRVVNTGGEGISNADISVNGPGSYQNGRSDGEGNFEITGLQEGTFHLSVNHQSYSSVSEQVTAGTKGITIEMRGRGAIDGHVFEARSRRPVTEFSVVQEKGSRGQISPWVLSNNLLPVLDEAGHFTLEGVEEGDATVAVTAPGYAMATQVVSGIVADETVAGVEIFLELGFGVEGVVVDGSGAPVVGAMIFHGDVPQQYERDRAKKAVSGQDGSFFMEGLPQGANIVSAYHPSFAPASASVDVGAGSTSIELVMGLGAAIEGTVTKNGKPVGGSYVNVGVGQGQGGQGFQTHVQTDANGHYEVKGLPSGEAMISAGFQSQEGQHRNLQARETLQDGLTYTINFDANEGSAVIRGMLLEGAGNPRAGHVSLSIDTGSATESAFQQVDGSGQFEFTGVAAGTIKISGNMQTAAGFRSVVREITVEAGGDYTVDLNVDDLINITCTLNNIPQGQGTQVLALRGEHALPDQPDVVALQSLFTDVAGHGQVTGNTGTLGVSEAGTYTIIGMVHQNDQNFALTSAVVTVAAGQDASVDLSF